MFKKSLALAMCALAVFTVSACGKTDASKPAAEEKKSEAESKDSLSVSVSFDAMKEFVTAVGGEHVTVSTIIPSGTEPHDFEPKAKDLEGLSKADVFVYNGLGMEAWAEKAVEAAANSDLIVTDASEGAELIENTDPEEAEEHGKYDPHLWLSISGAKTEIGNIAAALSKADPDNKADYEKNAAAFIKQLDDLMNNYKEKFESVQRKDFVTGHAAFGYLCRDFGLAQNSVEDTFAEGEPTAKQLAELAQYCKENGVTTIFAEEMASPEVSKTLADEVGAKVDTIYTMESSEDDLSYYERMEKNLEKIYESLK